MDNCWKLFPSPLFLIPATPRCHLSNHMPFACYPVSCFCFPPEERRQPLDFLGLAIRFTTWQILGEQRRFVLFGLTKEPRWHSRDCREASGRYGPQRD